MRNLEAVQQGLRVVRDALTPLVERVLKSEYGENWWKKGVLDALEKDGKPIHDRPGQGNAGDIDLQLALKLVQVYHWELFSDDMDWGGRQRSLIGAVTAVRNQYEGHVTPNREAELTDSRTKDLLEGMELFVNLFDCKAGERIGNIIEMQKMQQPEPELSDEGDVIILRRPVPQQLPVDHKKSEPERISRPIHIPKPEPVFPNGAAGRSMPEQAKPLWQRKKQVQWGAAVKNPQNKPVKEQETSKIQTKTEAQSSKPPIRENAVELQRTMPIEKLAAERILKPTQVDEKTVEIPKPPVKRSERKKIAKNSPKDPEPLVDVIKTTPGRGTSAQERPDPELYEPARLRRRTPRRLQRDPYEVDILTERNKKGENVLKVNIPRREEISAGERVERSQRRNAEEKKSRQRERLPLITVLRIILMTLIGIAMGVGLIWLDEWLAIITR